MLNELLTSNFDINYVALHTSLETPILYKNCFDYAKKYFRY